MCRIEYVEEPLGKYGMLSLFAVVEKGYQHICQHHCRKSRYCFQYLIRPCLALTQQCRDETKRIIEDSEGRVYYSSLFQVVTPDMPDKHIADAENTPYRYRRGNSQQYHKQYFLLFRSVVLIYHKRNETAEQTEKYVQRTKSDEIRDLYGLFHPQHILGYLRYTGENEQSLCITLP